MMVLAVEPHFLELRGDYPGEASERWVWREGQVRNKEEDGSTWKKSSGESTYVLVNFYFFYYS